MTKKKKVYHTHVVTATTPPNDLLVPQRPPVYIKSTRATKIPYLESVPCFRHIVLKTRNSEDDGRQKTPELHMRQGTRGGTFASEPESTYIIGGY